MNKLFVKLSLKDEFEKKIKIRIKSSLGRVYWHLLCSTPQSVIVELLLIDSKDYFTLCIQLKWGCTGGVDQLPRWGMGF